MTDEDVLVVEVIHGTMTGSLIVCLVTFEEMITSAIAHVDTLAVEVGTVNSPAAPYCHPVVALGTLTTVIPRHKQIVPAIVLEDKRGLDGVRTCVIGCRILGRIRIDGQSSLGILAIQIIPTGNGAWFRR